MWPVSVVKDCIKGNPKRIEDLYGDQQKDY